MIVWSPFEIYHFAISFLDKNILKLFRNTSQEEIFLFDYLGLSYCRNSDHTTLNFVTPRIFYYLSLKAYYLRKTFHINKILHIYALLCRRENK